MSGAGDGVELRVENGRAYLRRFDAGDGRGVTSGAWEETTDLSTSFAPNSDALGFLAGIKNVAGAPVDADTPLVFQRYTFEIDGPALARYMRDQMDAQLAAQGKLPPGVTLETSQQYRDATGYGELWLDAAGLPLRLSVHLVYPRSRNGQHVEAEVKTDFSGFPAQLASTPSFFEQPIEWVASTFSPAQHPAVWAGYRGDIGCPAIACTRQLASDSIPPT